MKVRQFNIIGSYFVWLIYKKEAIAVVDSNDIKRKYLRLLKYLYDN
jgi:hypothetical protein